MAKHYALVPAAGAGSRMGTDRPKQYLEVAGKPLLWHTLAALCGHSALERTFLVLAPDDEWFAAFDWSGFGESLVPLRAGGATRAESVRNGLATAPGPRDLDWVLVHDAARPCLTAELLDRLIGDLADDPVGGLLAVPVADTLKREGPEGRVLATEPRAGLWQAQTPQMFRKGLLLRALGEAGPEVTDEAGAVEALGLRPRLVRGHTHNFKVTFPEDLRLAELVLGERMTRCG